MKKLLKAAVFGVIAVGTLALVIPTPEVNACIKCITRPCGPCARLSGYVSCYKCPVCVPIEGCHV